MADGGAPAVLVIGVGNPMRGDDGVGPAVAQRLRESGLSAVDHAGDGAVLLELWDDRDHVIVVDATASGRPPGTITRIDAHETPVARGVFHHSSHEFGVAEAVETARALDRLPGRLAVYGIEGETFEAGAGLSEPVARAVTEVARRIMAELSQP